MQVQHRLAHRHHSCSSKPSPSCGRPLLQQPSRHLARSSGTNNSSSSSADANDEDRIWSTLAFPSYLQSKNRHKPEVCREFDKAVTAAERRQARQEALGLAASVDSVEEDEGEDEWEPETVWHTVRREAERDAAAEPLLSSFLYASILAHDTFERALAFVLSNRLANAVMLPTQLFEIFHEVLIGEPDVREGALADVEACRERDPACTSYSQALLYYKGYHAIQTHRIAHALWSRGQKVMAVALQSRMSEVLAVDIHPAARFGRGILLDHGTGVVIGETAVIGNNVSLLQNVTLGGTGKDHGDRHPKISDNVLIGACATVLGNIRVGEGAQIAAGSLVLKSVAPHTMVAGSPAKAVGNITGNPAEKMQQWNKKLLNWDPFCEPGAAAAAALQQEQQPPQSPQPQVQQPPASVGGDGAAAAAARGNGAAAAGAPSSSSSSSSISSSKRGSSRHTQRASIAAAEARWDAIAAQVNVAGGTTAAEAPSSSSSGSNGKAAAGGKHRPTNGFVNGVTLPVGNGSSPRPSKANGSSPSAAQQQQQQQQHSPAAPPPAQATAAAQPSSSDTGDAQPEEAAAAAAAAVAAAGRKQASADLRGIHEGTVEATLDEEVAAEKWAGKKEEPEYVI